MNRTDEVQERAVADQAVLHRTDRGPASALAADLFQPLGAILTDHGVALFAVDIDATGRSGTITDASPGAAALYGRAVDDLVGRSIETLFEDHATASHRRLVERAGCDGSAMLETVHRCAEGELVPVRVCARRCDGPCAARIVLAVSDIAREVDQRSRVEDIDEDHRRIAHELHDTTAQNLAAMHMQIALWKDLVDEAPDQLAVEIDEVLAELRSEIDRSRRAIFALRPVELDEAGFAPTLRRLVEAMERQYGLAIALDVPTPDAAVPSHLELPILRIVQEALNNVGRHAGAMAVTVGLHLGDRRLRLDLSDDGVGFDPRPLLASGRPGHYGLLQMRERARSLGGDLVVVSRIGRGTRVEVDVPLCDR